MDDDALRAYLGEIPVPELEGAPWVVPPPLAECTVAIVTTAALRRPTDEPFVRVDPSFRALPANARDLVLDHWSPSFDRAAFAADMNVVYPVDRLTGLAAAGKIGAVGKRHLSFSGSQEDSVSDIRLETGPRAAAMLRAEGVDVALLTPVAPMCSRTVCVLAHILEAHGIATVALIPIQRLAERMHPPRVLCCEFPLGRPLGRPGDAHYQHDVIDRAFGLLAAPEGPVIANHPDRIGRSAVALACPLPEREDSNVPAAVDEVRALWSAYDQYRSTYGRTSVGRVVAPEHVDELAATFDAIAGGAPWREAGLPAHPVVCALELRTYYEEAALAFTGVVPEPGAAEAWFYGATAMGHTITAARDAMRASDAPFGVWYYLATDVAGEA
ncbi:MAG: hypothetical protein EXQ79_02385 [Acidimicrobiia bacterium]|nr:hypothetical protein [Acidimicrobiia bacterium]